jgi:hypothetical protein
VPVTVPEAAEVLGLVALEELEELDEPDELELPAVGALVVPLAVVPPLYGVLADVLPPAAAAVDDVEVW